MGGIKRQHIRAWNFIPFIHEHIPTISIPSRMFFYTMRRLRDVFSALLGLLSSAHTLLMLRPNLNQIFQDVTNDNKVCR